MVWNSGKGLGQIQAEKESYTRGVEQAKLEMQKKQIADAQKMRQLARIDADEKETRRQLEWDAVARRNREIAEESKRRFGIQQDTRGDMTDYQTQVIEANKRAEQLKFNEQKKNEDMLRQMTQGNIGGQTTQPAVTQPEEAEPQQQGIMGLITPKQDEFQGVPYRREQTEEAVTPVQKSNQEQYLEGLQKKITPIDTKKLRVKAVSDAYNPKASASQNEMRIESKYNELLENAKEKNIEDNLRLISAKSKVEVAKQKSAKESQKPTLRETERVKGVVKKEQGVVDYYEGTAKEEGALQASEQKGFSNDEKKKMAYSFRAYNKIRKAEGRPELEFVKEGEGFGSKWRLKERIVVKDKDGNLFTIPESQLDEATQQGFIRQ